MHYRETSSMFRLAILLPLCFILGCGQQESAVPKVVVEDAPKKEELPLKKKEPIKIVEERRAKLVTLDLRPHGLNAVIDAPEHATVKVEAEGAIAIEGMDGFSLIIKSGRHYMPKERPDPRKLDGIVFKAYHDDTPDHFLLELEETGHSLFVFASNATIDAKPVFVGGEVRGISLFQAKRNFDAARTLRQPQEFVAAKKKRDEAESELRKIGGQFEMLPNRTWHVTFSNESPIEDKHLELLPLLTDVSQLTLPTKGKLTSAALQPLDDMTSLRRLSLGGAWVDGQAFRIIGGWTSLRALRITDTPITDFNLRSISNLLDLAELDLSRTRIGDVGLRNLLTLKKIRLLHLAGTDVGDKGMVFLKDFPELQDLSLSDTAVTDAAIPNLTGLTQIAKIDLSETVITDTAIAELAKFPALTDVNLAGTNVTANGMAQFPPKVKPNANWPAEEPNPGNVVPPIALDKLPKTNPEETVKRLGGMIIRDDEADGKPIVSVDLRNSKATDAELGHLRLSTKLRVLNLDGCQEITDAVLPYFANLTDLEDLNLRGTKVKGDGFIYLKGLTKLTKITLPSATVLTGKQLAPLAALSNLEILPFRIPEIDHPVLAVLAKMNKLKEFNLDGVKLTNRKLEYLKGLKNLEVLTLGREGEYTDRGLANLKDLTNLKTLIVRNYRGSNSGLANLKPLSKVKVLELFGPYISDAGVAHLSGLPNLERVRLDGLNIGDPALDAFRNLDHIIEISVIGTRVGDRGLEILSNIKTLEIADLSFTKITDAGLAKLKEMEELRSLRLDATNINGSGFKGLGELPRLARLSLANCPIDDAGAAVIAKLPKLRGLDLSDTPITDAALASFKQLRTLEELRLDGCEKITAEALKSIKDYRALTTLSLKRTKLSAQEIEEFRKALPGLKIEASGKP